MLSASKNISPVRIASAAHFTMLCQNGESGLGYFAFQLSDIEVTSLLG